jgi:predicted nucleic acid-binding protein
MIPDALIAATAMSVNQPFISKNQRDYRFISGLQLLPYPGGFTP